MSLLRSMAVGAVLSVFSIGSANAALIGVTDYGDYFADAGTGLDWLDVTASVNRSYNDVSTQLGAGGDFEGWRYASVAEFGTMLSATTNGEYAGITSADQSVNKESRSDLRDLVALFGDTLGSFAQETTGAATYCAAYPSDCPNGDIVYTYGYLFNASTSGQRVSGMITDDDRQPNYLDQAHTFNRPYDHIPQTWLGSYLVRQPMTMLVPEPASIALMGLGLAGLGFSRRKRKLQA